MFGMNEKIAGKIGIIFHSNHFLYDKKNKSFEVITGFEITEELIKSINKLGLQLASFTNDKGSYCYQFKRKPQGEKWLIATMSFLIMAIAVQLLYIADNAVFYLKP